MEEKSINRESIYDEIWEQVDDGTRYVWPFNEAFYEDAWYLFISYGRYQRSEAQQAPMDWAESHRDCLMVHEYRMDVFWDKMQDAVNHCRCIVSCGAMLRSGIRFDWNGTNLYTPEQTRYFLERLKELNDKRFEDLYSFLEETVNHEDGFLIQGP